MPALSKAIVSLAAAGVPSPRRFVSEVPHGLLERGLAPEWGTLAA
jgi:hypothetical protein